MNEAHWLTEAEQRSWRAYLMGSAGLQGALNRDLEEHSGMTLNEYEILVRLSEAPEHRVRMSVLAEHLVHSRSRLTHTIARMQRHGWVDRAPCADDGRGVEAVLTEEGYATLVKAAPRHVQAVREKLVDVLSAEQMTALGEIFTLIAEHSRSDVSGVLTGSEGSPTSM